MRVYNILLLGVISSSFIGCSGLVESTRESLLGDSTKKQKVKQEPKWVSKAQYDDLVAKYKNLNDKYQNLKEERLTSKKSFDQIDEIVKKENSAESIDVFGDNGLAKSAAATTVATKTAVNINSKTKFDENLDYYNKGVALYSNGKVEEAFKIFQYLESAPTKQLKVRAKLRIGNYYLEKNQFDLALQVYETIIREFAFSGVVIPSLRSAVVCTEKLGLTDKKLKYESILRDFFEVQV